MAFLTLSDIQGNLTTGYDPGQVSRWLAIIEMELKQQGLVFTAPVVEARKLRASEEGNYLFDFTFLVGKPTSVKIKQFNSSSEETLIEGQDYTIVEHINIDDLYYRIEMLAHGLRNPEYLEVTGSWGFMSSVPEALEAVITEYLNERITQELSGNKSIEKAKTADSEVTYNKESIRVIPNSFLLYDRAQRILSFYLI